MNDVHKAVETAFDKLSQGMPKEAPKPSAEPRYIPQRTAATPIQHRNIAPPRAADTLQPEHKALIGQYATVDLPDGEGVARLRIYLVTVRRDGRVRAEMRNGARTIYKTPEELRDVSKQQ